MTDNTPSCQEILQFLRDLSANNERSWFLANKDRYLRARADMERLAERVIGEISAFDPSVARLTGKDCLYRIYRDVRFSPDKRPYKEHMGCYVNPMGRCSLHVGYYLHIQPFDRSFVAGGTWQAPTNILNMIRQKIVNRTDEFRAIVEEPRFKRLFPSITDMPLKVMPRGLPKDFPYPQYVKCRSFCVGHPLPDSFFDDSRWSARVGEMFRLMKPFLDFLNEVIDDYA